jgi:preprotein translocase subunit SecA
LPLSCEKEKAQVIAGGRLRVIGKERHEAKAHRQSVARAFGRQGDPGVPVLSFFRDDLFTAFGGDRMQANLKPFPR